MPEDFAIVMGLINPEHEEYDSIRLAHNRHHPFRM